ncbi:hypothetical protein [Acetonema longum]|uniref:Uncharacterized protein n=1 Tax=Acetonema longum DSM 6540 TaxID=1009370 RepID=F7NK89_9FIRM|nr:hypothetical protein [Acetonema longum]EGO63530.1 hypothetical protein ALO_12511 [Acetonema longum DSM 6540]
MKYKYNVYNNYLPNRPHIMTIEANSPAAAVKKAYFDFVLQEGGKVEKTRRGKGYTNTAIYIYLPEQVAAGAGPEWTMERVF